MTDYTRNKPSQSPKISRFISQLNSQNLSLFNSTHDLQSVDDPSISENQNVILLQDVINPSISVIAEETIKQMQTKESERFNTTKTEFRGVSEIDLQQRLQKVLNPPNVEIPGSQTKVRRKVSRKISDTQSLIDLDLDITDIKEDLKIKMKKYHIDKGVSNSRQSKSPISSPFQTNRSFNASRANSFLGMSGDRSLNSSFTEYVVKPKQIISKKRKQNLSQIREIPEWLKQREDFRKSFSKMEMQNKQSLIVICEKLSYSRNSEEINEVATWLRNVKVLKHFPTSMLQGVAAKVKHRLYQKDEIICNQGDLADCLYIVYDGAVRCIINGAEMGIYQVGQSIGQAALEGPTIRASTLIAALPTSILRLERDDYKNALEVNQIVKSV